MVPVKDTPLRIKIANTTDTSGAPQKQISKTINYYSLRASEAAGAKIMILGSAGNKEWHGFSSIRAPSYPSPPNGGPG